MTGRKLWVNGELVAMNSASSPILAHGLHYGTGVFEGIRAYATPAGPAVFRLDAHLRRMKAGAELLGMPFDAEAVAMAVDELLEVNGDGDAYVRPLAWYAAGGLALDVEPLTAHCAVATLPWTSHLGDDADNSGVSMCVSPYRRISSEAVPPLKLCGLYLNSILAKRDASAHGFDEALFVDVEGWVVEATGENVFMVTGGRVIAVDHPDALPGITRSTVAQLADATSRRVSLRELREADEIFLTGTSAEVAPVRALDGRKLPVGAVTRGLQVAYQDVVHGRDWSRRHWLRWAA